MKKIFLLSVMTLLIGASAFAQTSGITCIGNTFFGSPREVKLEKTQITINQDEKTLTIESTSGSSSFMTSDSNKQIKKLEIDNIKCHVPSIARGILRCYFRGYNRNGLPLSQAQIQLFSGDKISGVVGGHLEGNQITTRSAGGLDGQINELTHKELSLRITLKPESNDKLIKFQLRNVFFGLGPVCTDSSKLRKK